MRSRGRRARTAPVAVAVALAVGAVGGAMAGCGSDRAGTGPAGTRTAGSTGSDGVGGVTAVSDGSSEPNGTDGSVTGGSVAAGSERFPDIVDAIAERTAPGVWRFDVTVSSPYDTPERYADAWRVVGDDGVVYGVRELTHDHAAEQPFTRSLSGVEIPDAVRAVTIEGRDQQSGWGGATVDVVLDD